MIYGFKHIIKILYDKYVEQSAAELERTERDAAEYRADHKENMTAILSNTLATLALSDSSMTVEGESDRAGELNKVMQRQFKKRKKHIADALGTGMIVSVPRAIKAYDGWHIYIDTITKDKVFITGTCGDDITQVTTLSEFKEYRGVRYLRLTDYSLENGVYVIRQKALRNNSPYPIENTPFWADMPEEIHIDGADRLPIGIFKCPTSNRRPETIEGVPVTFGCKKTLEKIEKTLEKIEEEFDKKEAKVYADQLLLGKNKKIDTNLFITTIGGGDDKPFYEVYSPDIRSSVYFEKFINHCALLEKQVGVSRGVLTDLQTQGATATEIRKSMYSTFAFCDDIQENYEQYFEDLIYGINLLMDSYGITVKGDYEVKYDWTYGLIEDPKETFEQKMRGESIGAISKAEIRSHITGEDLQTAEEAVKKIEENEPKVMQGAW